MALNRVGSPVEGGIESILGKQRRSNGTPNTSSNRIATAGGFVETGNYSARVAMRWMPFDCRFDFCDIFILFYFLFYFLGAPRMLYKGYHRVVQRRPLQIIIGALDKMRTVCL